nr:hypothetical protein [Tanacetum cinerariifolium]
MEAKIQKNGRIIANGDPNEETGFPFVDLAKKIKNIDGKVLRKAVRGYVITRTSPLKVVSFDNVDLNSKSGLNTNAISNDMGSSNPNSATGFDGVGGTVDMNSQLMMAKNFSFASVMGAQPNHKVITLSELRNDEVMEGAAVTLPLAVVDEAGMDRVLESRPCLIRRVPLILHMWSPNVELKKDEVKTAPVWIKLHHVPIVAYTEVGLSLITTQIGKPIMLDSYTCNMCVSSWGRSSYARALIEVSTEKALMESIVIAIPLGKDKGHSLATVEIEYEWKPPQCDARLVFDHTSENCPKKPKVIINSDISANDVVEKDMATDGFEVGRKSTSTSAHSKNIHVENSFSALNDDEENEWKDTTTWQHARQVLDVLNESDSDVDEVITLDDCGGNLKTI